MLTFVPLPDFRDSARALMHDLPRLRAAINESLLCLRVLRGEVNGWQQHPCVAMWRGAEAGLYLLREEYRAAYAEATGDAWGEEVAPPASFPADAWAALDPTRPVRYESAILPAWWGDEAVHGSHRAILKGKWEEGQEWATGAAWWQRYTGAAWPEKPARRLPRGSWPYAWPLPCDGKGYVLRVGSATPAGPRR